MSKFKQNQADDPEIYQGPEWAMILDNLEQMHPRYLATLLKNGMLKKVARERLASYARALERMEKENPSEPYENLRERAQAEILTPTNQNWQDEEPLNQEETNLLMKFRQRQ